MLAAFLKEEYLRYGVSHGKRWDMRLCAYAPRSCGCEHNTLCCRLNHAIHWFTLEVFDMARNKKIEPAFTPTTFVRCELTAEEKKDVPEFIRKNTSNMDDLVVEVLQTNHKISFSFNGQTDSFICSVTGKPEDCNNASKCYTSHAKDYATALWVALYKFHVVWQRGVWEEVESGSDFG